MDSYVRTYYYRLRLKILLKKIISFVISLQNECMFIAAYHMAGETTTAMRVFTILVGNAVAEERFSDAGYLHHLLAMQCLETAAAAITDK